MIQQGMSIEWRNNTKKSLPFFLKLHCPKMDEILDKILPYEDKAECCQIFRLSFGQWSYKKKCFCDLLTFRVSDEQTWA